MTRPNHLKLLDHVIPAHAPWSGVISKGQYFRIIDTEGQQAVDTLFYNAHRTDERYSPQDTLLTQAMAYVSTGTAIMSNEGNAMLTVTDDTSGMHDTSVGCCSREANVVRFGEHTRYEHACRENFLYELAKYGLNKRDLVPNLNFFMCVPVQPDGTIAVVDGVSKPGSYIEMRAEMDVLCVISNCPQINNPCNGFDPTPVQVQIWAAG